MSRLPAWLDPLYTADEMRALDAWAIHDEGVPSLQLMERAGAEVVRVVTALAPDRPVRVVCGKGNNGGDGFVVVRLLAAAGLEAEALLLADPEELRDDARVNFDRLAAARAGWRRIDAAALGDALAGSDAIVDAMLGTGFEGTPRAPLDAAIDAVNSADATVIAVDVPSGVNATTGEIEGAGVRADVTVTFHAAKVGLGVDPGKSAAGRVEVVDIGIPAGYGAPPPVTAGLIRPQARSAMPSRGAGSTKFSSGSVLVVGGSTGLTGAVCLACEAAMRAGAGWVRAGVPESLNSVFEVKLTEVMSVPLPDAGGALAAGAADAVVEAAERADAVALGPGLGRDEGSFALAVDLVERIDAPLLIDADALNALAEAGLERAATRTAPTVLTPHAGELGRLLSRPSKEIAGHRLAAAREAAERSQAVVVLKGDDTLVAQPGAAPVGISRGGAGALATAGTGDVLSGVTAAFLARGLDPFRGACAAVETHQEAGREAARWVGSDSVVAGDVIAALPAALRGGSERPG